MKVSVILRTDGAPSFLEKAIWGYATQCHRDFELLIADHSLTQETGLLIQRMRNETDLNLRLVLEEGGSIHQPVVLNKAICAASSDYIIFSDSCCVPRWDFVAQHVGRAKSGCMLFGDVIRLPEVASQRISTEHILSGQATSPSWLRSQGVSMGSRMLPLLSGPRLAMWLDRVPTARHKWNSLNSSAWKDDILRANGFDERMKDGDIDRELGERMHNAGIRTKQIRHQAICLQLDQTREQGGVDSEARRCSRKIRLDTQRHRFTWTPHGILQGSQLKRVFSSQDRFEDELDNHLKAA